MTSDRRRKKAIRERMNRTGESYTAATRAYDAEQQQTNQESKTNSSFNNGVG